MNKLYNNIIDYALSIFQKFPILSKYISRNNLNNLIKYLLVGFSSAFLDLFLYYIFNIKSVNEICFNIIFSIYSKFPFIHFIKISPLIIANSMAYIIVFFYNFTMQKCWAFKSSGKIKKQLPLYALLFTINLLLSNKLIVIFVENLNIHYMLSKIIVIGIIVSWNFVLYKKVIFKK